jgi:hypothetical protein
MTKNLQKMAVAAAAILGLGATSVKSAEAASVKLTFFEDADTPAVGVGSFSYDESTPYEAIFGSSFFGTRLEIKASDKWFVVQDLAVNLLGLSWNLSQATVGDRASKLSPLLWAPFDRNPLKVVGENGLSGSPQPYLWGNWAFGNLRTTPYLVIFGNSDGPGSRMDWLQASPRSNGSFGEGYVIAEEVGPGGENPEPVPEPATTAGLAMAAAGLGYAKKKFGASKV